MQVDKKAEGGEIRFVVIGPWDRPGCALRPRSSWLRRRDCLFATR